MSVDAARPVRRLGADLTEDALRAAMLEYPDADVLLVGARAALRARRIVSAGTGAKLRLVQSALLDPDQWELTL